MNSVFTGTSKLSASKEQDLLQLQATIEQESRKLMKQREDMKREKDQLSVDKKRVDELRVSLTRQMHYLLDSKEQRGVPPPPPSNDPQWQQKMAKKVHILLDEFQAATIFTRGMYSKHMNGDPKAITEDALRIGCGIGRLFRASKSQERRLKLQFISALQFEVKRQQAYKFALVSSHPKAVLYRSRLHAAVIVLQNLLVCRLSFGIIRLARNAISWRTYPSHFHEDLVVARYEEAMVLFAHAEKSKRIAKLMLALRSNHFKARLFFFHKWVRALIPPSRSGFQAPDSTSLMVRDKKQQSNSKLNVNNTENNGNLDQISLKARAASLKRHDGSEASADVYYKPENALLRQIQPKNGVSSGTPGYYSQTRPRTKAPAPTNEEVNLSSLSPTPVSHGAPKDFIIPSKSIEAKGNHFSSQDL